MKIRAFITHKKAESYSECQDRFAINPEKRSLAVSDGMSQSIFQTMWAQMLVEDATQGDWKKPKSPQEDEYLVETLSKRWYEKVQERILEQRQQGKDRAADRNERSLVEGRSAGATLAVVHFSEGTNWEGAVLGDSCIIPVNPKNYNILDIYTSQNGEEFDNYPDHYDSNPQHRGKGILTTCKGTLGEDCSLLIVSDPLSDLLHTKRQTGEAKVLIEELLKVNSHDEFVKMVESWRDIHQMHNDDTTLLIVDVDASDELNIAQKDDIKELIVREEQSSSSSSINSIERVVQSQQEISDSISTPCEEDIRFALKSKLTDLLPSWFNFFGIVAQSKTKKKRNKISSKLEKLVQKLIEFLLDNYEIRPKDEQPTEHNGIC